MGPAPGGPRRPAKGDSDCGGRVARRAAFCRDLQLGDLHLTRSRNALNNRSKFNVALGIEAQGFCVLR